MENSIEVIGIDHGWSQMKTANSVFTTGVEKMHSIPAFYSNVLEYKGEYYKVGSERLEVKDTKVENEDFYLLTLAAVGKELAFRGKREANVFLAVGLPLTRFGKEKQDFINYLSRNEEVDFTFEEKMYHIKIVRVAVYPQCYAAIAEMIPTFPRKVVVVDIGSWTLDILPVIDKKPDDQSGATLPKGLITCMRTINKNCVRKFNLELDEMDIQNYMMHRKSDMSEEYVSVMESQLLEYAEMVLHSLTELKINIKTSPIVFVGGGACVMKNFGTQEHKNISYKLDVKANAKGYEALAKIALNVRR